MENDTHSSIGEDDEDIANLFDVVISDPSPADKRAHHNALERKRRDLIKSSFHSLQVCVPNITDNKASRAQILKKATAYIALMKEKIDNFQEEINEMRDGQKTMEQQVLALEKIKATSTFAQTKGFITKPPNNTLSEPILTEQVGSVNALVAEIGQNEDQPPAKRLRSST